MYYDITEKSLTRPHSELNFAQVVVGELAHRHSVVELCYYFLLLVEKNCTYAVQTVI